MPRKKKLPPNVRRHGSGFRAVFTIDGDRQRGPTFPTVEAAAKWLAEFDGQMAKPESVPLTISLAAALDLIYDDLRATGAREATFTFYKHRARPLLRGLGASTGLDTLTAADIRRYLADRLKVASPGTVVGKELFILRRMRKLAAEAGFSLPVDPFFGVRMPRGRSKPMEALAKPVIGDILARMRANTRKNASYHADIVEALFGTGMRRTEFGKIKVADIDFAGGFIRVDGKTGDRHQTFGEALVPVLRRLVARARNGRIVPGGWKFLSDIFTDWKHLLGLQHFSPHTMRHSYGTEMADHVHQLQLQHLMAHKTVQMTSRYYNGRGKNVRAALDHLRPESPAPSPPESGKPEASPDR